MSIVPDSEASKEEGIEVCDTPEYDNPQYGATTISLWHTKHSSQSIRMARNTAEKLWMELGKYLWGECPLCSGRGEIGRMTAVGVLPCATCGGSGDAPVGPLDDSQLPRPCTRCGGTGDTTYTPPEGPACLGMGIEL